MNHPRESESILTLRANVSESEAFREFRSAAFSSLVWRLGHGPLQRIALVYLPFSLYRLEYELGRTRYTRFVALDQIEGALDLIEFPAALGADDLLSIHTRNKICPALSDERAESLLQEKSLRLIFQQGFFRLSRPRLELDCALRQFHIPYWIGLYGKDGHLRCRALDAVRRRMEGAKAALLFERWLTN